MTYDFIVFGGTGQQGRICCRDLLEKGYKILILGRDKSKITSILKYKNAKFLEFDLKKDNSSKAINDSRANIVINCAELEFNIPIMKACLKTKKDYLDLGGLQKITKKQFDLNKEFKKNKICAITGCGSTPGISNVMTAYLIKEFDTIQNILLGFAWDSNIKKFVVPYSIKSIVNEFTNKPVVFFNGKFKSSDRLHCQGTFNFKEIGKQTCYCIVHSEVYTFARYFKDKGLKRVDYMAGFPKHSFDKIRDIIKEVSNSKEKLEKFSQKLKKIRIPRGYQEIENLWVRIQGLKNNEKVEKEINCIVKPVPGWENEGSNVDTGRAIAIMSIMLKRGLIRNKFGVFAPEVIIPQRPFFEELAKRKMFIYLDNKRLN